MTRFLLAALAASFLVATSASADVPYWQARSGLPNFARAIAVDPTDPNVVYVAVSNGATYFGEVGQLAGDGILRSTDGGYNWVARNNGLGSLVVVAITIDFTSPNVLYAGLEGKGVYKSTDSGGSWSPMNTGLGTNLHVYSLAMDPSDPGILYVGLEGAGLSRSVHGGAWTAATGLGGLTVNAIAIDPVTPTTVYAGTNAGVKRSTDGGASFVATGALTTADPAFVVGDVQALAIDASNPSTILAGTGQGGGVFRSTDGGTSWAHSSVGLRSEFGNWQFMSALAQDPTSPAVFYASSTRGTYRSHDGGQSWASFNAGLAREYCLAFGVHAGGAVYTGSVFLEFHRLAVRPSGVNHFRCFRAKAKGFSKQTVTLTDRFGTATTVAARVVRYCAPTDPMGEGIVDATAHLVCYKIKNGGFAPQQVYFLSQRIDGYRAYYAQKADTLCLPATVGVPAAAPRDAYRCVAGAHWRSDDIDFTIADSLGSQLIRKHTLGLVCGPTDLDGAGENRIEDDVDLRCDRIKGKGGLNATTVTTTDRFGTLTLRLNPSDSHCFPALESRG
jgi:photosystem II stability/assembly factor-like uncharacterized protein